MSGSPRRVTRRVAAYYNSHSASYGTVTDVVRGVGIGLMPGVYWFPVERVSLDMTFGSITYSYDRRYVNDELDTRNHWLNAVLNTQSLNLSLLYHFK